MQWNSRCAAPVVLGLFRKPRIYNDERPVGYAFLVHLRSDLHFDRQWRRGRNGLLRYGFPLRDEGLHLDSQERGGFHLGERDITVSVDTTPPAAVANLSAGSTTQTTAGITWTAPSDSGSGSAASYSLAYGISRIASSFDSVPHASGLPVPAAAGTPQAYTSSDLSANTTYYVALKSFDASGNVSAISNVASFKTNHRLRSWVRRARVM
jgi:hypothetical protein